MNITADVVIVGAGIVGAACAYELAKEKLKVCVIDKNGVGTGATAAGMGHLVTIDDSAAQFALTRYSQTLWNGLRAQLPASVEYERTGTLWVAADDQELAEVHRKHSYFAARGVKTEVLDAPSLRETEPCLRPDLAGALLVPEDAVVYPPSAASFLLETACRNGAQTFFGHSVTAIGKGKAQLADGTLFTAGIVVNAAGQFAPHLTPRIDVRSRKGHLVITDRYPGAIRHQLVELGYLKSANSNGEDSVAFNIQPRKTGQLLIGSSRQYEADGSGTDPVILAKMLERAFEYFPALAALSAIRVWTGHRAATRDKLPLLGPWPEDSTVYLAAGHEGLGITTSLASGRIICDQIFQRNSEIPTAPYLPSRPSAVSSHV